VVVLEFAQIEQKGRLWLKEPHITKSVTVSLNFSKAIHPEKFSQNWTEVDAYGSQNIAITQYMEHVAPKTLELFIEMAINAVAELIPRCFLYFNVPILTIISGALKDLEKMRTAIEGLNLDPKNYKHGSVQ
jgi:hypothetical protein